MAQWGQGQQQGFQYPMQTGFPAGNPQFQQNPQFVPQNQQFQPGQNPTFQQQPQFQQGGLGAPNGGGLLPQQTGFVGQRPQGFQQPQQTGFPGGSGFVQPQPTGFAGGNFQQNRPALPPVPQIPQQFQQPGQQPNFLNLPPPQPSRLLSASPGFAGGASLLPQPTGFGGRPAGAPLVPQITGYVDPRIMMMAQTFMPTNTSAPYGPGGVPQLPQQQQNLVTSIQELNQTQRGTTQQQIPWALTKAEKKNYNNIFRSWDAQNTGFINGTTALEVFGASGLPKDDLARIWTLADMDDRGKLNLAEFHVAMGLIYRRLNGMPVPDQLPAELKPPSAKDLDNSVDLIKDLLKHETRSRSPAGETSYLRNRSFTGNSALDTKRDATIYRHNDNEPPTNFYQSRNRHVDRSAIRARDDDSPASDLEDMKRRLANSAQMLDRAAEAEASKTKEDEELDQEMEDLKYRVKRVQDDLDYAARGPRTASKEEDKRRFERELLSLMHERIPEVERKIKARDERKERERRQWARDRDRANERFGRFDSKDDYSSRNDDRDRDRPYSRGGQDDRDRPYSRGGQDDRDRPYSRAGLDDRERPYSRGYDDRDRPRSRGDYDRDDRDDRNRDNYHRDRPSSRSDGRRDDYDRPRSPPRSAPPPPAVPAPVVRAPPPAPSSSAPQPTPSPSLKSMTAAERSAFLKAEAARRIQGRMAALGVTAPSSPVVDTSVEDRLQQEKKEAEEKAKAAEKQAEERERARRERLANEKAIHEDKPGAAPPAPTPTATAPPPAPAPKVAPPPPKPRAPAPPPPRKAAPRVPAAAPPAPRAPLPPSEPEVDPEEEALRAREEALRKAKEERERRFQERLRQLEKEEEEARLEEERYQARIQEAQAKAAKAAAPAPAPVVRAAPAPAASAPPAPPPPAPPAPPAPEPPVAAAAVSHEKSTNPFSRLLKEGAAAIPVTNGGTNPWAPPPTATPRTASVPPPSKSPAPSSGKNTYQTASSSLDDDWDDVKEKSDDDGDSSDDEITASREARAKIAQSLFGGMLPRPTSAAASGPVSSPSTPAPVGSGAPPPPPPPPSAPPAPRAPVAIAPAAGPPDFGSLFSSVRSAGGLKLRPTKTVDKSAPPVSGKVLGDTAPPAHINAAPRPASPPSPQTPRVPETLPMAQEEGDRSSYRQSVGWFADRAADVGSFPPVVQSLPSTAEDDEEEDIYVAPADPPAPAAPAAIPEIHVDEPVAEQPSDLMADIDKSIEHRVRSLYAFQGDGPEDLSFGENIILEANPSKSGGEWWYGKTVGSGQAGLFPKTYVEVITPKKAKAVYTYTSDNTDELAFTEGEILSIVDTSEEEWWKAEAGGVVFIVPAAYLELVEESTRTDQIPLAKPETEHIPSEKILTLTVPESIESSISAHDDNMDENDTDTDDSDSDYLSFEDSDDDEETVAAKEAREREKQRVLEAAGLIVNQNVGPPPLRPKARSVSRRPAPAAPRRVLSIHKDLPPVPDTEEPETEPAPEPISHEARLDDAFARYESFKNLHAGGMNRLSVISTESSVGMTPTTTISSSGSVMSATPSQNSQKDSGSEGRYSNFLHFLTGGKGQGEGGGERRTVASLNISAPIMINSGSNQSTPQDGPSRSNSPSFGMSWASLVNKNALDGIPPGERKRQEAIFELINTEVAYVRDLQLIVEVFYSSMLPMLSTKEITVIFANIEDLLLVNTAFVSSLEERQKECRLYVDKIGDILLSHIPNMGAYMEYCVNQSTAIQVLKSLRDEKPELMSHLQHLRDENPTVRNLDLSSYLLAPMQRATRYPLLIRQIEKYTEIGEEYEAIKTAHDMAEKLLEHINETIRQQEGQETLRNISQNLWIGQGRLDLTAPTRYMGPRRLLKQGVVYKAKSRKKLNAFLCSDILVLLDESMKNLYRMPIPLAYAQVKENGPKDETGFQISQNYQRGGDVLNLRALSVRDCQQWINEIVNATKRSRHAEERAARKTGRR